MNCYKLGKMMSIRVLEKVVNDSSFSFPVYNCSLYHKLSLKSDKE